MLCVVSGCRGGRALVLLGSRLLHSSTLPATMACPRCVLPSLTSPLTLRPWSASAAPALDDHGRGHVAAPPPRTRRSPRPDPAAVGPVATWIELRDDPPMEDLGLDPGETAAILLAEGLNADALLIDERRGRSVAAGRGIAVIGTLGILAGAKRAGAVDSVAPIVELLRADGFWLSEALVETLLKGLGEDRSR
ncbi:MAG: DUF3368 domain-containing protein [Myxococcales bacterium]|nr:DUF3368 domain-containing protein [Myxococcales bacterium]